MIVDNAGTQNPIVFIVDDEVRVLQSLKVVFESNDMEVRTFGSARDFLDAYLKEQPGCLITDVRMSTMSGLELQEEMNRRSIKLPVIMLTGYGTIEMAVMAMKAGAVDFIEKHKLFDDLLDRARAAIDLSQNKRLQKSLARNAQNLLASLTPRQRQILDFVADGEPTKRIAFHLGLSKKTIEFHRANIMKKLKAKSLADLIRTVIIARSD